MEIHSLLQHITPLQDLSRMRLNSLLEHADLKMPSRFSPAPYLQLFASWHLSDNRPWAADYDAVPGYRFLYIACGHGSFKNSSGSERLRERSLFLFSTDSPYRLSLDTPFWEIWSIHLDGPAADYYHQMLIQICPGPFLLPASCSLPLDWLEFHRSLSSNLEDPIWQAEQLTLLLGTAFRAARSADTIRCASSIPSYLLSIRDTFHREFAESFSLDQLEMRYRISKFRISKEFAAAFGKPPIAYLNHCRLEEARRLLLHTDYRINEIGSMVGFDSTNHFINLFHRQYDLTPGAYRKQHTTPGQLPPTKNRQGSAS